MDFPAYRHDGLHSVIGVPLISRGHLVGVVCCATRLARGVSALNMEFVTSAAGIFAVEIQNSRLFDEVRQALHLREEFISTAAHELRSPVTVIQGRVQMTLKEGPHDERTQRALESIQRAVKRIDHLVDDLFAVLRVRPGAMILHREPLDLVALIDTVIEQTLQTGDYVIELTGREPVCVQADRVLIGEVLRRLLENAMRLTPRGRPIEVGARRQDRRAVVAVTDHGVGIPRERQPFAFEPFYELIPGGCPGYTGVVSLGLYLSKQIVEAHGGRIWLVSTPPNGATFFFSLPLALETDD